MNTLLGELGTYNDIQYPRHRFAFKLRKLQTSFLLHHHELPALQEIMHSTGVQPLDVDEELTENQMRSIFSEIFTAIKSSRKVSQAQLQEAHTTCLNWFLMAFQVDSFNKATVGKMKIALTLFCGSKPAEKAKYLFSILAKNGTLGRDGIQYFCEVVQIIADCLSEVVYSDMSSIDRAMSECLYLVRDHDDIEDEEEDGGLQRPWLSCFELVKVFTANPSLNFLSWLDLWFSLPQMEKIIHNVKCSVCDKKSIVGFRYQCGECSNFHMCQMCFLKGRTSEPHALEHKVYECTSYSKGLKSIFSKNNQPKDSRVMNDVREAPALRMGGDCPDGSTSSLHRLSFIGESPYISHIRSPSVTPEPSHRPTELRIGSRSSLTCSSPIRQPEPSSHHRLSMCSTTSSEQSFEGSISPMGILNQQGIGDVGMRKQAPILSSLKRTGMNNVLHHSLQKIAPRDHFGSPVRKALTPTHSLNGRRYTAPSHMISKTCSSDGMFLDSDEFTQLNRKLSYEVDQLLKDIEPEVNQGLNLLNNEDEEILDVIEKESKILEQSLEDLSQQKSKLSTDLDVFLTQVQSMHSGFTALKQGGHGKSSLAHHQLHLECHHQRGGSLDASTTGLHGRVSAVW